MEEIIPCSSCGANNASGKSICDYCGADLTKRQPGESVPDREPVTDLRAVFSRLARSNPPGNSPAGIVILIFGIPWTVFSLVFFFMIVGLRMRDQMQYNRFKDEGRIAQGVITKLEVEDSDDSTDYYVDYRFSAPFNGEEQNFEHYASVSRSVYQPLETGGKVEIIYAASDPGVSTVKAQFGPPSLLAPILGGGMSLLFTGIGLAMIISGFRAVKRFLQLRKQA